MALFPWPDGPPTGARLHERVAAWLDRAALWGIAVDDPPEPENRVELDPDTTVDGDDLPGLRLTYRIAPACREMLAFNAARARESFEAAGAVETVALPLAQDYGWHLLGTCRMGDDPETSVVDRWAEAHDHPGLFIADSSVFVTGGSMNPAATIAALSLRTAAHILATRGGSWRVMTCPPQAKAPNCASQRFLPC
jgi:choline dehydrogenase-like flavoprotein